MRALGVHVGRPKPALLDRLLEQARQGDVTYDHVGSTLASDGGRRPSERRGTLELGRGDEKFARAVEALRAWRAHAGIRALVHPAVAPLEVGTTLLVVLRAGPFAIVAPNRVVATVDEPNRFGFAYGTLVGHPESGEECFVVERSGSGAVTMTVRVDARPATLPARLAAPVVNRIQRWALQRYMTTVRDHIGAP